MLEDEFPLRMGYFQGQQVNLQRVPNTEDNDDNDPLRDERDELDTFIDLSLIYHLSRCKRKNPATFRRLHASLKPMGLNENGAQKL